MIDALRYQLEQTSGSATLYVTESLTHDDAPALTALFDSLPMSVRVLRVDLRAIGYLSADAIDVIRRLLRHWGTTRRGEFRLTTAHLIATYRPVEPEQTLVPAATWATMNEALAGTYL